MDQSALRSLVPSGDRRRRWTAVAAGAFGAAGLLSALLGAAVVALLGVIYGASGPIGPVGPGLGAGIALWFLGPVVGGALVGGVAWVLLVEVLARRAVAYGPPLLVYPGLGGLAGALGGAGLHVVTWEVILVGVTLADGPLGPALAGDLAGAVLAGAYVGLTSVFVGGVVTVPALGLAGILVGAARHLGTGEGSPPDADRSAGTTADATRGTGDQ